MHISRKVDAAAAANDPLARLYRCYYRIATDMFEDLPEAYQMWVGILTEDVMVALEAVTVGTAGAAGPDRQYTGLRQHCVLYTDATRALYRTRAELMRQSRREVKGAVRAEKREGKLAAPPDIPVGRDLRTLWPLQATGEVGDRRTVSEYDGPEDGRAAHRNQALEAAARRYVPTEMLPTRKSPEENGVLLHRWLGLGATQASAEAPLRRASGQRRKRPGKKGLITGFLKPMGKSHVTAQEAPPISQAPSVVAEPITVDFSESLLASQSALGPYWSRGVSRKRDRQELVELSQEEDFNGECRTELGRHTASPDPDDKGYDSCDSEGMNTGFRRYKKRNLAAWLGTRLSWEG